MGIKKETTKEKFESIWSGLDYHMKELSRFFLENENDPFLQTDYGKKMEEFSKTMSASYLMGKLMMTRNTMKDFITKMMSVNENDDEEPKETEKPKEGEKTFSMEDMLKSVFGKDDKKEDEEP